MPSAKAYVVSFEDQSFSDSIKSRLYSAACVAVLEHGDDQLRPGHALFRYALDFMIAAGVDKADVDDAAPVIAVSDE